MNIPMYQVDAFATKLFEGNPAAVVPLKEWLPEQQMQQIAAENNLSETAFFVKEGEGYHLRWFTPMVEVDLCGHATLASAHVIFNELGYEEELIRFQTRSGELIVGTEDERLRMDFPADDMPMVQAPDDLFKALGIQKTKEVYKTDDYMVVLDTEAEVAALEPDLRLLKSIEARGVIVTAPGEQVDFVSRFFAPQSGVDEDPVTGSAHTKSTPYWSRRLEKKELEARQISQRGGSLSCRMNGDRVEIIGSALTFFKGEIQL